MMGKPFARLSGGEAIAQGLIYHFCLLHGSVQYREDTHATSWSSGRVQDSGLGSRSSPGLPCQCNCLLCPLSTALHTALLLLTSLDLEMGTREGRFVSCATKLQVSGCILPRELRWISRQIWTVKGPMTREGICQSLQSRALSLYVDSKQWLYHYIRATKRLEQEVHTKKMTTHKHCQI